MTTYVVGDVQGCYQALMELLAKIEFDPSRDRLWSVGDLINRGPHNLSTLRWFFNNRDAVTVVLGNHDLHLLANYEGAGRKSKSDNFQDILDSQHAGGLLEWLRHQPLMHREGDLLMTHAGIPPCWNSHDAIGYSQEVEACLRSDRRTAFFKAMYGNEPYRWSPHLSGLARLRTITNYFTRMRYCTMTGGLDFENKDAKPVTKTLADEPLAPWFKHPSKLKKNERLFFGHWASLQGKTESDQFIALDTGFVWGGALTAICTTTHKRHQVTASGQ